MTGSLPYADLSDQQLQILDRASDAFEEALERGEPVSIEQQLQVTPDELRGSLFPDILTIEVESRMAHGDPPSIDEYLVRFPGRDAGIRNVFREQDPSAERSDSHVDGTEAVGSMIGPYKLRELIGEGGMGLVYSAEQELPVRRKVAVKIIKPGMDTKEVLARFEAERQALAMMEHPNIAQVLDVGATENGRPYFVMELIRGVPVTEYCDQHKLPTRTRLEQFVQICQAVQHAHQKGIIHRDIKPTNILVTVRGATPIPKVIDFGVAKAINQRLTERTVYTQQSQLVGTPMYMSPEQADRSALDVDTRTDIYSLGVVLYELLTGTTPFAKERLSDVGYDELRRIIRDEDPPRPSQRLSTLDGKVQSTVSDQRGAGQLKLVQIIRGELDWIVMKAMDKDVTRRYESAGEFAADIQRYLADEPVLACPASASYRLRKSVRRNKVAVAIATLMIAGVLASIAGLVVSNVLVRRQRERADENFRLAREAVDSYFTLVSQDTLLRRPGLEPLRKGLIDNAVEFYDSLLEHRGNDAEVLVAAANTRIRLAAVHLPEGNMDEAVHELEKAFDVIEELLTRLPAGAKEFRNLPGFHHYWPAANSYRNANDRAVFQRAVSLWRQFVDAHPDVAAFRRDLAFFLQFADYGGNREEGIEVLRSVQRLREELVAQHPENREMLAELAITICSIGHTAEDPSVMREGIAKLIEADLDLPEYRAWLAWFLDQLGWRLMENGQNAEAAEELQKSLVIYRELAREFPDVTRYDISARAATSDLARALLNSGQQSEAEQLAMELSPRTGSDFVARGHIYRELRLDDKASADYEKALELGLKGSIPLIRRVGDFFDKIRQHEKAILFYNHDIQTPNASVYRTYAQRGAAWAHLGQYDKALADFTTSIEIGASNCEFSLSQMRPRMLRESPADFQAKFLNLADRAIEITEGNGQSYITRSLVHFMLGQRERAKEDLARGVELDPVYAENNVPFYLRSLLREIKAEASPDTD